MAKVKKYRETELPSRDVGIPSLDLSEARTTQRLSNMFKEVRDIAREKEQQISAAFDESNIAKKNIEVDYKINQMVDDYKEENANNPRKNVNELSNNIFNMINALPDDYLLNDRIKRNVTTSAYRTTKISLNALNGWMDRQEILNSQQNIVDSSDNLAMGATKVTNVNDLSVIFQESNRNVIAAKNILSPKQYQSYIKKQRYSIATGYALGRIDDDDNNGAETLIEELESGALDEYFTPKQKFGYLKDAREKVKKLEKLKEEDRLQNFSNNFSEIWQQIQDGQGSVALVEQMEINDNIDSVTASNLKDYIIKKRPINLKREVSLQIWDKVKSFKDAIHDEDIKENWKQILDFNNKVLEASKEGFITESETKTFLSPVRTALIKSIENKIGGLGWWSENIYEVAYSSLKEIAKEGIMRQDEIVDVLNEFVQRIGDVDYSKKLTSEQEEKYNKVLQDSINAVKQTENPILRFLDGTPNALYKKDGIVDKTFPTKETKLETKNKAKKEYELLEGPINGIETKIRKYKDGRHEIQDENGKWIPLK